MAKRRYNLSDRGKAVLQASARSLDGLHTGPKTREGKFRSSLNAMRTGDRGRLGELNLAVERAVSRVYAARDWRSRNKAQRSLERALVQRRQYVKRLRQAGWKVTAERVAQVSLIKYRVAGRAGETET